MNEEKYFYERYLNKNVRITKETNGKNFFYNGTVKAVLDNKLVLIDKKIGQVIFSFDEIKVIEQVNNKNEHHN